MRSYREIYNELAGTNAHVLGDDMLRALGVDVRETDEIITTHTALIIYLLEKCQMLEGYVDRL